MASEGGCSGKGVYASHAMLVEGRRLAAVSPAGRAVLSHRTRRALGPARTDQTRIDVTAPRPPRRPGDPPAPLSFPRCQDTTSHRASRSRRSHRTLLDLSRRPRATASWSARSRRPSACGSTTTAPSQDVIARSNGHRGTGVARRKRRHASPSGRATSGKPPSCNLLRDAGLPEPLVNEAFHAPDHGHCEPDYHWPAHRVIVETDGWETHRHQARRSGTTAPRTPPSPPPATASSGSPATTTPDLAIERLRALLPSAGSRPRSG